MVGKVILEFYLYDIDYIVEENKAKIRLFGSTKDGKKVVAIDENFLPYFYVLLKNDCDIEVAIRSLRKLKIEDKGESITILDISEENKKYVGKEKKVLKLTVKLPKHINLLREKLKEFGWIEKIIEKDIPFAKRYLLDKKLPQLSRIRILGENISEKKYNADYIIKIEKIEETENYERKPKILAFDIEVYNPIGTPRVKKDPIMMISFVNNFGFKKVITWKKFHGFHDYVEFVESEMDLIKKFVKVVKEQNPDIIITYNGDNFDFYYITERAKTYRIPVNLGIDNSNLKLSRKGAKITGIPHVDLYNFIRNIIGPTLKTETYDLNSVSKEIIGKTKKEGITVDELNLMWDHGDLIKMAEYNLRDSEITLKLMEKLMPILFELTRLVGQSIFDVSRMTYGQCVEWYLMQNASKFNELIPNKPKEEETKLRSLTTYAGAFVYEPKPGLYEKIVVYDFRSLYPSIIVSHNICPTTINCECEEGYVTPKINGKTYKFCKKKKGFIPSILEHLIIRRANIKEILKNMKEEDENYNFLSARSYALKTVANAMYGYMGFPRSRWYCLECAASITAFGRYYINKVIEKTKESGFEIIYGDTDSIMISLGSKTKEDAKNFFDKINKELPGIMKLDFQGYYPRGIFVTKKVEMEKGAKKKYALVDENNNIIIKGFAFVRRDWSLIAKKTQMKVLKAILIEKSVEKALNIVKKVIKDLREYKVEFEDVIIHTQLTRPIEAYESIGPHVAAALKAIKRGYEFEPGQIIKYIVIKGEGSISNRAFIIEEVLEKNMKYDPDYYIDNQVIPAVEKIFEVLGYSKDELKGKIQTTLEGFFK